MLVSEVSIQSPEQLPKLADLRLTGEFDPQIKSSHPKHRYENSLKGEKYIVKAGPSQSVRADFIGNKIFSALGLSTVPSAIDINPESGEPVLIMDDVSEKYKPLSLAAGSSFRNQGLKLGDFLKDPAQRELFKDSILATILIGDYDRVPWNLMAAKDGSNFVHLDFGASMGVRARGGYNGYSLHIDEEEIRMALRDPYDREPNANELHGEVIEVTQNGIEIKDKERLARLSNRMQTVITDSVIDSIVAEAAFPDNATSEGKSENRMILNRALSQLEAGLAREIPGSLSHLKTERAITTYKCIRDEYNGDSAAYFSNALKTRRDELIKMFGQPDISEQTTA